MTVDLFAASFMCPAVEQGKVWPILPQDNDPDDMPAVAEGANSDFREEPDPAFWMSALVEMVRRGLTFRPN